TTATGLPRYGTAEKTSTWANGRLVMRRGSAGARRATTANPQAVARSGDGRGSAGELGDPRGGRGVGGGERGAVAQLEAVPVERRGRGRADERPLAGGAGALPRARGHHELRPLPGREVGAEHRLVDPPVGAEEQQPQGRARVPVVGLGGGEPVHRRELGRDQQEVDRRRVGVDVRAPEQPALVGQRLEPEQPRDPLALAHHAGTTAIPPSTTRSWPVTKRAIGEARNTHASATSRGSPSRRSGAAPSQRATPSGQSERSPGRLIRPGETELTRTPSGPYSNAAALASMIVAAFAAA